MEKINPMQVASKNLITLDSGASVGQANKLMSEKHIRHLLVTTEGKAVGLVSDRDVAKADATLALHQVMSSPLVSVDEKTPLLEVVDLILNKKISSVLISNSGAVVGIITTDDLILILKHHLTDKQGAFWGESIVNEAYSTPMRTVMEVLSNTGI